jgi:hypothetical protein
MWLLVDEFNSVLVELSPFLWHGWGLLCTYRLFQLQLFFVFQLGWALTLSFLFSTLQWVVTYMWLVDEFNSSIGGTIPISLSRLRAVIVRTGSSSSNYFGIFQLGWALTLCSFQHAQWVYPYIDYSWMNSTHRYCGTIPIWDIGPLLYVQALPAPTILVSFRDGPNPFVPFQHAQWVVTYMWLLVDEFNSQYWWNYPHFFDTLEPLLYVQALPAQLFWYQLGWA